MQVTIVGEYAFMWVQAELYQLCSWPACVSSNFEAASWGRTCMWTQPQNIHRVCGIGNAKCRNIMSGKETCQPL